MCYGRGKGSNISNKHVTIRPLLETKIFVVFGNGLWYLLIFRKIRLFAGLTNFGSRTKLRSYFAVNRFGTHCMDHGRPREPAAMSTNREYEGSGNELVFFVQGWMVCTECPLCEDRWYLVDFFFVENVCLIFVFIFL